MARVETRLFILMMYVFMALFAADRIHSEAFTTAALIAFPLVLLTHLRAADTSTRVFGPVWLRRAQLAFVAGVLLASILVLRVF